MELLLFAGIFFGVTGIAAAVFFCLRSRKMYRIIDKMQDEILNRQPVTLSDLREGKVSMLACKAKRIQEMLEFEIAKAEEEKEQVKGLISNMSHQLKSPLANLIMYEEILEQGEVSPADRLKFLKKMRIQSEKLDWILQSLFKMVKLEQDVISFEAEEVSIRETILDAINMIYEKAEKKEISIVTKPFEDKKLYHNRKWTAEVFVNLLENAVKYSEPESCITIECISFEMYTQIRFTDRGRGVRKEEQTEIFKRFYRSRDVEHLEGSGIGLYLCRLILEKEKGYLNVESEYGKGSRFSVFLQNCKN